MQTGTRTSGQHYEANSQSLPFCKHVQKLLWWGDSLFKYDLFNDTIIVSGHRTSNSRVINYG
jgi:hypothetical protein